MTEREALRLLQVNPGCSDVQLRQAYMDLVKVWHPDRFQADARLRQRASRTLQDINQAYATLQRRTGEPAPASTSKGAHAEARTNQPSETLVPPMTRMLAVLHRPVLVALVIGSVIGIAIALRTSRLKPSPVPSTSVDIDVQPDRLPRTAEATATGPESGAELRPPTDTGTGQLSLRNDTRRDAVIALVRNAGIDRVFFVRRGAQVTLLDLMPGTYRVRVVLGEQWTGRAFEHLAGYFERGQLATVVAHEEAREARPFTVVIDEGVGMRVVPAFPLE